MRLFVAVTPPRDAVDTLAARVQQLRADWPQLRWVPVEQWHLTLAFLGEVAESVLPRLEHKLANAARRSTAMTLRFGGAGTFPERGAPRVLWTSVDGDTTELTAAARNVADAARAAGVDVERRRYRAHLTLARVRPGAPVDAAALVAALSSYAGPSWSADELHLVRSHLGPSVRHEVVSSWPLGARPGTDDRPTPGSSPP